MNVNAAVAESNEAMKAPPEEIYLTLPKKARIKKGDVFLLNTDIKITDEKKGTSSFSKGTEVTATGNVFGNKRDRHIEVIIGKDGKFSIRSVPPISHLIAREFGGGGHPNAAGGSFNFTVIERFTWWLFKKSRHFDELVNVAERL